MLYYRTHASRNERPPELIGWESTSADANLTEQIIGEHRILGITPQFVFAPPETGWVKLCAGWEIASAGEFDPIWHANKASKYLCFPATVDDKIWLFPIILTKNGTRAFKVVYGGPEFLPILTPHQESMLKLATEIRTAHDAGTMPDVPTQARWTAALLPCTYALSPVSLGVLNILTDDIIQQALAFAGGYHDLAGT